MLRYIERAGARDVKSFIHMDAYGSVPCLSAWITKVTEHGPWIKGINLPTLRQMALMDAIKKTTRLAVPVEATRSSREEQ